MLPATETCAHYKTGQTVPGARCMLALPTVEAIAGMGPDLRRARLTACAKRMMRPERSESLGHDRSEAEPKKNAACAERTALE